ncbi:MAG: ABC transporter ATP-binding protein [Sphaerobacter sp.]|nr:ABC transporter ATP-binding protein [Sphaerobacter sp.]
MTPPIDVQGLTRAYGTRRGIIDLTFTVEEGEIFGFLGPNGAGKTTTIRVLMGLLKPTSGRARIFGLDCWADAPAVKARVGYLPGEIFLYERMTGAEFLDFMAAFRDKPSRRRRDELAERLDLDLSRPIRHLSKGNRQKLAIVQALMHGAPLLILDEPTDGLDPLRQHDFLDLIREERERGTTIFLSSHLLGEVERVADRVAIVREGQLVAVEEIGRLKQLWERRLSLVLREPVPVERLTALGQVEVRSVAPDGRRLELGVHGPAQPLLRLLAELPVEDFTYAPADLESVFLHYYGAEARPDGAGAVAERTEVER